MSCSIPFRACVHISMCVCVCTHVRRMQCVFPAMWTLICPDVGFFLWAYRMRRNHYIYDLIREMKCPSHLSFPEPRGISLPFYLQQPNCLSNEAPGDATAVFSVALEIVKVTEGKGRQRHLVHDAGIITCPATGHHLIFPWQ